MENESAEATRAELKRRDAELITIAPGRSTVPGCRTLELCHKDFPMPLGIIWISFPGRETAYINNSFVDERFRRCGIRSMLHWKPFDYWPNLKRIISGGGTEQGKAWMTAIGYKQTVDRWEFRKKRIK